MEETTKYSSGKTDGEYGNYHWGASFDITTPDNFIGITQDQGNHNYQRVLLSWSQFVALQKFVLANKAPARRAKAKPAPKRKAVVKASK
jgi:hypothetical protein